MLNYHFDKENYPDKYGYKPSFEILEVVKGKFKNQLKNGIYYYVADWSGCDRIFKKGYSYIVFGHFQDNGEISTSICTLGGIITENDYFDKLRAVVNGKVKTDGYFF